MASSVSVSNVVLPPIRTLFPRSTFPTPSCSPSSDEEMPFMPMKQKKPLSQEHLYPAPRLPFQLAVPKHSEHSRRASTTSTASVPSLTHSPSPSPSPSPSFSSPQSIRLVPCALKVADVVVLASKPKASSCGPSTSSPRKLSGSGATLLVGSAISRAAKDERKMHPYRIVRERRV